MTVAFFMPFPPATLVKQLPPRTWKEALDSWTRLGRYYLSMNQKEFRTAAPEDRSLVPFLVSFAEVVSSTQALQIMYKDQAHLRPLLSHQCFCLTHRLLSEEFDAPPGPLLEWTFLGDFSTIFSGSASLEKLLEGVWNRYSLDNNPLMLKSKKAFLSLLDESQPKAEAELDTALRRAAALLRACSQYGRFLMVGTEFPDAVATAWLRGNQYTRNKLVTVLYRSLSCLLDKDKPNVSLLLDHLYALKANTENQLSRGYSLTLLSQLVSSTPIIRVMQIYFKSSDATRATPLLAYLEGFNSLEARPKRSVRRERDKGKSKAPDAYGHGALGEVHVHKMSLVTQIQDLFPDLGSGFVVKLLDEYHDDAEQVTAHLLDDSLPPHLKNVHRQHSLDDSQNAHHTHHLEPRPTPPLLPTRKNVFDNDAFDNLTISPSNIHLGRKHPDLTASDLLDDHSSRPNKAAILSALAGFDADDDERDDTYDVADVGGTVDTAIPGSDEVDADLQDKNEEALFSAYKMSPEVFKRDAATRRGKARAALKSETGMTDEAIEGWAIMLARDPRRLRRLEAKFSMAAGAQRELASTAYREGAAESGTEGEEGGGGRGGRGGSRPRGGARGRGRGGDVAGPADDRATQVARQRKDANKGSRANHNRRDQRARKVARAGFPG